MPLVLHGLRNRRLCGCRSGDIYLYVSGITLPLRAVLNVNLEIPEIVDGTVVRPAPEPIVMTITVDTRSLTNGTTFVVYRWDVASQVPSSNMQYCASTAPRSWVVNATE